MFFDQKIGIGIIIKENTNILFFVDFDGDH